MGFYAHGCDYVVSDKTRRDRAVIHCGYWYRCVLQTTRKTVTVSKRERHEGVGCAAIDERICMYRLMRGKGKDKRNKEMVRRRGTGLDMGGENELGSMERRAEGPHAVVETDMCRMRPRRGCPEVLRGRGLRSSFRAPAQAFPEEGPAFASRGRREDSGIRGHLAMRWLSAPQYRQSPLPLRRARSSGVSRLP